jgi:hypothetical protein
VVFAGGSAAWSNRSTGARQVAIFPATRPADAPIRQDKINTVPVGRCCDRAFFHEGVSVGCHCLYLVPTTAVAAPRQAIRKPISILADQAILWVGSARKPEFTPGHFSFRCGENGRRAFDMGTNTGMIPFETCYLFGADRPMLYRNSPELTRSAQNADRGSLRNSTLSSMRRRSRSLFNVPLAGTLVALIA